MPSFFRALDIVVCVRRYWGSCLQIGGRVAWTEESRRRVLPVSLSALLRPLTLTPTRKQQQCQSSIKHFPKYLQICSNLVWISFFSSPNLKVSGAAERYNQLVYHSFLKLFLNCFFFLFSKIAQRAQFVRPNSISECTLKDYSQLGLNYKQRKNCKCCPMSLFIEMSLWILRLLFSIVRNVTSVCMFLGVLFSLVLSWAWAVSQSVTRPPKELTLWGQLKLHVTISNSTCNPKFHSIPLCLDERRIKRCW